MRIIDSEAHSVGVLAREKFIPDDKPWIYPYNPPASPKKVRELRAVMGELSEVTSIVDDLIAAMDKHGIEKTVVMHGAGVMTNDMVADTIKKYPDRLAGFAHWDPYRPIRTSYGGGIKQALLTLERGLRDLGLIGVGEVALSAFMPVPPDQIFMEIRPIMDLCQQYNVPIFFHTGWSIHPSPLRYQTPIHIDDIALEYPEVTIILAHMGRRDLYHFEPALMMARRHENVYLTTSHTSKEFLEITVNAIGSDRILFGTDWTLPYRKVAPARGIDIHAINLKTVREAKISDRDKEKILGENIANLLHI